MLIIIHRKTLRRRRRCIWDGEEGWGEGSSYTWPKPSTPASQDSITTFSLKHLLFQTNLQRVSSENANTTAEHVYVVYVCSVLVLIISLSAKGWKKVEERKWQKKWWHQRGENGSFREVDIPMTNTTYFTVLL